MHFNKGFIVLVCAVTAMGGLLFGFDTAVISGAIPYITRYFKLDEYMLGWAVSAVLIGCAIGALASGKIADRYGRRPVLIVGAVLFMASGIGAGLSHQLMIFIFFRLIGGLGVGSAAMVSPMYIAEIAPANLRGRMVSLYQMGIVLGILVAYFSNYLLDGVGVDNWRWMFMAQSFPSVLFGGLLLIIPESPRWLVMNGRVQQATAVLARTVGNAEAFLQVADIQNSIGPDVEGSTLGTISKSGRRLLFIGVLVAIFQQITGINAILYYAPVIFKETGLDGASSLFQTIFIGIANVLSTFLAIGLVDKIGRRKLLLSGCLLMAISLAVVGACFQYHYFGHYVVLIFLLIYVCTFASTLGAGVWVYLSEIFPNRIRGMALSIATLSLWIADFAVTYAFPIMVKHLGTPATLFSYAIMCFVAFAYMSLNVKETKGKSLEEIEILMTLKD